MKTNQKTLIIAGYAGVGKSVLGNKYQNVLDLESSPYRWDYSNVDIDHEKLKGAKGRTPNKNYPQNYIDAIEKAKSEYDIICVWMHFDHAIPVYVENNIDFVLCFPSLEAIEEYKNKYVERGNTKEFADHLIEIYEEIFKKCMAMPNEKIILGKGETLEAALLKMGVKLIEK